MHLSKVLLCASLMVAALATLHVRAVDSTPEDDVEIEEEPLPKSAPASRESTDSNYKAGDQAAGEDVDALGDLLDDALVKPSKDAEMTVVFVEPNVDLETRVIPPHEAIRALIGVRNRSNKRSLYMDAVQASLRYPGDFNYAVQNFTLHPYRARQVAPQTEATLEYMFSIHESLAGRPFGLFIYANYHDDDMRMYRNTIFNDTITISEPDEKFDTETMLLYALGGLLVILFGILAQQYLIKRGGSVGNLLRSSKRSTYTAQRSTSVNKAYERGTSGTGNSVDQEDSDWLPVNTYNFVNQSPKTSPKKSPRTRLRS